MWILLRADQFYFTDQLQTWHHMNHECQVLVGISFCWLQRQLDTWTMNAMQFQSISWHCTRCTGCWMLYHKHWIDAGRCCLRSGGWGRAGWRRETLAGCRRSTRTRTPWALRPENILVSLKNISTCFVPTSLASWAWAEVWPPLGMWAPSRILKIFLVSTKNIWTCRK